MSTEALYLFSFYVPVEHADSTKAAAFKAGAGKLGDYEHCCWQTIGQGQFRPVEGANPFVGELGSTHHLDELKVEMIVKSGSIKDVVVAMKQAHPYEEPAYHVVRLVTEF